MKRDKAVGWLSAKPRLEELLMSPGGLRSHINLRKSYQSFEVAMNNQWYDLCDPNDLQIMVDLSIAPQQGAGTSRTQAGQTNNEDEEDDEDSFKDYKTDENEYEVT
ncbi:UNVERIFIED_CONTAM: hypothetical protein Sindi_2568900 [Sesamum indicum]